MIELNQISMSYPVQRRFREYVLHPFRKTQRITAISEVTCSFKQGDRVAILGPNGAGKTTLLKLIGGLLLPTQGTIRVNGYDTQLRNLEARGTVGYAMNEERSFYWRLSGRQNLEFFGALDNTTGVHLKNRIDALIESTALSAIQHKRVGTYSSGMKQRLAIVRGLLSDPKIIILDEPTRTLDPIATDDMVSLIKEIIAADNTKTLLISTHALSVVQELCNKVCVINHHTIVSLETVEYVLEKYATLHDYYKKFG